MENFLNKIDATHIQDPVFLQEILNNLPVIIYLLDEDYKYIFVNKSALDFFDKTKGEVIGKFYLEVFPDELADKFREFSKTASTKDEYSGNIEIKHNGRDVHLLIHRKTIHTVKSKKIILGYAIDVTESALLQKKTKEQQWFIQQIIDTDPNYIYVKDKEGELLLVNQACANLFEVTKEELIEKGVSFINKHAVQIEFNRDTDLAVIETGQNVEVEEELILADGTRRWLHTTKAPLPGKGGEINILGISVDITKLQKHATELIRARTTKEKFLANISHEIRTPINGIVGMIKLLEATPTLPQQRKYIDAIRKSSETLQVLINDLLDLSIIDSGKIKLEQIGFQPKSLLTALVDSFRYTAQKKDLHLTLNYDPYIDDVLIGDPIRLNQIIQNLIANSIKFTPKGHIKLYALRVNDEPDIARLNFIVEDSGIGIPKDNLKKIFESFEQGEEQISRNYGGTGLGLSIVKRLVDLQNGSISVESIENTGTTFKIELEYAVGVKKDIESYRNTPVLDNTENESFDLSGFNLLLVEDNDINLLYTKMILDKCNCRVDTAPNGLQALEMLKENNYDLILMDVLMPVMNGFDATAFIRKKFDSPKSDVIIIALTANAMRGDVEKCRQAGMDDYLSKPFKPDELKKIITKHITPLRNINKAKNPTTINKTHKIIDLSYLIKISDNNHDFITEMVTSFIKQTPGDIKKIKLAAKLDDWDEVASLAHKIKPSITFMGIESLKSCVSDIQEQVHAGNTSNTHNLIGKLEMVTTTAFIELRKELEKMSK